MGTTYNIVVVDESAQLDSAKLQSEIETVLAKVNSQMSNWDPESEISRFNAIAETMPVQLSVELATVMAKAQEVHEKSDGMFDITTGPLIELWGFGPRDPEDAVPSQYEIERAMERVGQTSKLRLDFGAGSITKNHTDIEVNLSAIAKGYGIDAVASRLSELGFQNHLVEIGGDLRATGKNSRSEPWRVGIEKPQADSRAVKRVVVLSDMGMATSGDYRNFVEFGGVRYSHIIDPSTGYPITHRTTSVSVVAEDAMTADAWATALLVLGNRKGLEIANEHRIAAYFISRGFVVSETEFVIEKSEAFELENSDLKAEPSSNTTR
ncbi:MAG: FAD:protein FMN transferase [Pseudomonadota bacterium]